jgi:cell wall-associated NlpC family hydrolase
VRRILQRDRLPTRLRAGLVVAVAAVAAGCGQAGGGSGEAAISATPGHLARLVAAAPADDVEAAESYPLTDGTRGTVTAPAPDAVPAARIRGAETSKIAPGAPSDAEIRRELGQMERALRKQATGGAVRAALLARDGTVEAPESAPERVARIIAGANAIAHFPYVYGGGHGSFTDTAYDCSGSLSYALASAGLLDAPLTSGQLAQWGEPGPGRWVTIYANAGHTFMEVAGLRFDTRGRAGPLGSRWQTAPRSLAGFTVRHPPGL